MHSILLLNQRYEPRDDELFVKSKQGFQFGIPVLSYMESPSGLNQLSISNFSKLKVLYILLTNSPYARTIKKKKTDRQYPG